METIVEWPLLLEKWRFLLFGLVFQVLCDTNNGHFSCFILCRTSLCMNWSYRDFEIDRTENLILLRCNIKSGV